MWEAIPRVLGAFAADAEVRVGRAHRRGRQGVRLRRRHLAVREGALERRGGAALRARSASARRRRLQDFDKPMIAMIRGYCLGGGLNIADLCDLRIAADDARFGIPAAKMGLGYRASSMKNAGRPGRQGVRARDHAHRAAVQRRGGAADGARAQAWCRSPSSRRATREYCDMIAANAPLTMRAAKRIIREVAQAELRCRRLRRVGEGVLRERGLRGRPPRLHGKAKARLQGPLERGGWT